MLTSHAAEPNRRRLCGEYNTSTGKPSPPLEPASAAAPPHMTEPNGNDVDGGWIVKQSRSTRRNARRQKAHDEAAKQSTPLPAETASNASKAGTAGKRSEDPPASATAKSSSVSSSPAPAGPSTPEHEPPAIPATVGSDGWEIFDLDRSAAGGDMYWAPPTAPSGSSRKHRKREYNRDWVHRCDTEDYPEGMLMWHDGKNYINQKCLACSAPIRVSMVKRVNSNFITNPTELKKWKDDVGTDYVEKCGLKNRGTKRFEKPKVTPW